MPRTTTHARSRVPRCIISRSIYRYLRKRSSTQLITLSHNRLSFSFRHSRSSFPVPRSSFLVPRGAIAARQSSLLRGAKGERTRTTYIRMYRDLALFAALFRFGDDRRLATGTRRLDVAFCARRGILFTRRQRDHRHNDLNRIF